MQEVSWQAVLQKPDQQKPEQSPHLVDLANKVFANDIIHQVDTALNLCVGYLATLPEEYRNSIHTPYVAHLKKIEDDNNVRFQEVIQKATEEFRRVNQDLLQSDKTTFDKRLDFHILKVEDDLLYQELSLGFGKKSWGLLSLRSMDRESQQPVFEPYRWLHVLFNRWITLELLKAKEVIEKEVKEAFAKRGPPDEERMKTEVLARLQAREKELQEQKTIQAKEILAKPPSLSLIDLLFPKDNRLQNEANNKRLGLPVGIFSKNAKAFFDGKMRLLFDRHGIVANAKKYRTAKLSKRKVSEEETSAEIDRLFKNRYDFPAFLKASKEQLKSLTKEERLSLICWSFFQCNQRLLELRIEHIRKLCEKSKAFIVYTPSMQFPAPAIRMLTLNSSKLSIHLTNKRTSDKAAFILPAQPAKADCQALFEKITSCRRALSDLDCALAAHLEIDFTKSEREQAEQHTGSLTSSFGSMSTSDKEPTDRVQTATKLIDFKKAYKLIHTIFHQVHNVQMQKNLVPYTL